MASLTENTAAIYNVYAGIKSAIESKGVTVHANTPVSAYAGLIRDIPSGGSGVIDSSTDWQYMFANGYRTDIFPYSGGAVLNSSRVTSFSHCFDTRTFWTRMDYPIDMTSAADASYMFYFCRYLPYVVLRNTGSVTNAANMFQNCYELTSITGLDTSSVTNAGGMFWDCNLLQEYPSLIDLSKASTITSAFRNSGSSSAITSELTLNVKLREGSISGQYLFYGSGFTEINIMSDTTFSNVSYLFSGASKLKKITGLDISGTTTNISSTSQRPFYHCTALETTEFNGLIRMNIDFSDCIRLTHDSLINILNALDSSVSRTCTLGNDNLAKLSDSEKEIATDKGWTLA